MAQYDLTYSCGHDGTVALYGKETERQSKLAWMRSQASCPACYKAGKMQAETIRTEAEAVTLAGVDLGELAGSPKQVTWAASIRTAKMAAVKALLTKRLAAVPAERRAEPEAMLSRMLDALGREAQAAWWIDRRDLTAEDMVALSAKLAGVR